MYLKVARSLPRNLECTNNHSPTLPFHPGPFLVYPIIPRLFWGVVEGGRTAGSGIPFHARSSQRVSHRVDHHSDLDSIADIFESRPLGRCDSCEASLHVVSCR